MLTLFITRFAIPLNSPYNCAMRFTETRHCIIKANLELHRGKNLIQINSIDLSHNSHAIGTDIGVLRI